jgi:RDD family
MHGDTLSSMPDTNPPQATWYNRCGTTFVPAASANQPSTKPPGALLGAMLHGRHCRQRQARANRAMVRRPRPHRRRIWPASGPGSAPGSWTRCWPVRDGVPAWGLALAGGLAFNLILLVAIALYETVLLVSGGQTLGKMLFGLRVVRVDRAPLTPRDVASAGCQR